MSENTIVPIMDPNRGWRVWHIDEIFTGEGVGSHVPNKDDLVLSWIDGFMRVVQVDYSTGLSVLEPYNTTSQTGVTEESDRLLGVGPGRVSESYRLYIDTSVTPHAMAFDARCVVYGSDVRWVKVFLGTVIEGGEVISRQYDQQGQLLGENLPLETVRAADGSQTTIKVPKVGSSSKALQDGETVTAVFYNEGGTPVSTSILLVKNTNWIRRLNESTRYITSIELESPFLSDSDGRLLECPINVPMDAITRRGIVRYSNGETRKLPIDGTKFSLYGLQRFVSTILGQKQPVTLVYKLSPDEVAYGSVSGETMHLTEDYLATTVKVDGAYSVKIFTYPVWIDAVNGYRLEHFLYNLERDQVYNVTPLVELATNSQSFKPLEYGVAQDLVFAVDLSRVDDRFKDYRHLQSTRITLLRPGLDNATNWTVTYDKMEEPYGEGLKADLEFVNSNLYTLRVDNGFGSLEHWLREIYEPTLPLYDATSEDKPPTPNFFRLIAGSFEMECSDTMWNHEFTINTDLNAGEVVYLQFFRRTSTTDLHLATAGLIMRQLN